MNRLAIACTAAVYPILLPERTELLLSFPEGARRFTVAVDLLFIGICPRQRLYGWSLPSSMNRRFVPCWRFIWMRPKGRGCSGSICPIMG